MESELIVCFADGPNKGRAMRRVLGKYVIQHMRTTFGKERYVQLTYVYEDAFRGDEGVMVVTARLTKESMKLWRYHKRGIPTKKDAKFTDAMFFR